MESDDIRCTDLLGALDVLSLGAGVQSSTMALMAACGEITPMPAAAIFADTQAEPAAVYAWLDWLEKQLPYPVYRVTRGSLLNDTCSVRPKGKYLRVDIPAFIVEHNKVVGLINRSCTRDYKIQPIRKKLRELAGYKKGQRIKGLQAMQWIGISLDEIHRMKDSRDAWIQNRWPLIEKRMSRHDCLRWMKTHGYPKPPKSACIFCPYHDKAQWQALPPAETEIACEVDERLRAFRGTGKVRLKGELYIHKSGRPLREVLANRTPEENSADLFGNECEGMCGV